MAKGVAHAGKGKSLSSGDARENERRGWTEESYRRKNRQPMNNYDWSRNRLNFEIADGKILPLGSQDVPLYDRYLNILNELDFKQYKDGATNQQHTYIELILSGSTEKMQKIAFGDQVVNYERNPEIWHNWNVTRTQAIEEWATDAYNFACKQYGKENIQGFEVHLDETEPHVHVNIVPTAIMKQRGNISGYIKVDADGNPVRYTKGKHIGEIIKISDKKYEELSGEKKKEYRKNERGTVRTISFATYFGSTLEERSKKLSELHDEFYLQVGKKWGFERGDVWALLPEEERRKRGHRTKREAFLEQQAKAARETAEKEVEKLDDAIEEKKQEHERMSKETWLDVMKGLANKSDKDKRYLAKIDQLEQENLAVDENGNPVLDKSGKQSSWPRYVELLRSMIKKEKQKRNESVSSAVAEEKKKNQANIAQLNRKVSSLEGQLNDKDKLIDRLKKEKDLLLQRIKHIKDGFLNHFNLKVQPAIKSLFAKYDDLEIVEKQAVEAIVKLSKTPTKKDFDLCEKTAIDNYLKMGGNIDDLWEKAKPNTGTWDDYAKRILNDYANGERIEAVESINLK